MEEKNITREERELAQALRDAKEDERVYSGAAIAIQSFIAGLKAALNVTDKSQPSRSV